MSRAPQRLEFNFERLPIFPIRFALGTFFCLQCALQRSEVSDNRMLEQRAQGPQSLRRGRKLSADVEEQLRGAKFAQPELEVAPMWLVAILELMRFHKAAEHRPIFVALGFLCLNQVRER